MTIGGAVGVCIVDWEGGMSLGARRRKYLDLDVAAAGNTEVIRAKMRAMESLRLDDSIEDILITLSKQYHPHPAAQELPQREGPFPPPRARPGQG